MSTHGKRSSRAEICTYNDVKSKPDHVVLCTITVGSLQHLPEHSLLFEITIQGQAGGLHGQMQRCFVC